jgi:hypothetical protein
MTALSMRIEIFVLPGSGAMTGPRFAREKSIDVGLAMRVDHHEQGARGAHAEGDEPLLVHGVWVFSRQRVVVRQDGCGF